MICFTFFFKGYSQGVAFFLQKVRGPFLSKPELPLQSHCRQSPPAFGNSCGPHAMWQLASPTGPSYKLPKGLMSCHQSQCQCLFSRHTPPFHLPHTFACRNVPLLHLLLPLPPTIWNKVVLKAFCLQVPQSSNVAVTYLVLTPLADLKNPMPIYGHRGLCLFLQRLFVDLPFSRDACGAGLELELLLLLPSGT